METEVSDAVESQVSTGKYHIGASILTPHTILMYREALKLTQQRLAELLGVHQHHVANWESPVESKYHRKISNKHAVNLIRMYRKLFSHGSNV